MNKIIITGANGFVGSFLVRKLKQRNISATCVVRKGSNTNLLSEDSDIVYIDYDDEKQMKNIFSGHKILVHLAALTKAKKWDEFQKANIDLTAKLIDVFNASESFRQFIFISSQAAAGPSEGKNPKDEFAVSKPISMYGKSKLKAEKLVRSKTSKMWTIIRPASVYGPGDKDFLQYFRLIKKHFAPLVGFGKKYISLIYVEELVDFIIKTFDNEQAFNEIFFASDGEVYTWEMFAESLSRAVNSFAVTIRIPEILLLPFALISEIFSVGKYPTFNREKAREMMQTSWLVSNRKAVKLLEFKPEPNLTENLRTTYFWYKSRRWI